MNAYHKLLDRDVIKALLKVLSICPIGMHVKLTSGEIARVHSSHRELHTKPVVAILYDAGSNPLTGHDLVDLADDDREIQSIVNRDELPEDSPVAFN